MSAKKNRIIDPNNLPARGTGESRQAWRERCRFLEKQAQKKVEDPRAALISKEDGLYMRLDIESCGKKGFRIRQVGTDNFLRGPTGQVVYFDTSEQAWVTLNMLKEAADKKLAQEQAGVEAPELAQTTQDIIADAVNEQSARG